MHYIKPVRVTLACLNILFVFGREWLRLFPSFFVSLPHHKGCNDDDDNNDDDG